MSIHVKYYRLQGMVRRMAPQDRRLFNSIDVFMDQHYPANSRENEIVNYLWHMYATQSRGSGKYNLTYKRKK